MKIHKKIITVFFTLSLLTLWGCQEENTATDQDKIKQEQQNNLEGTSVSENDDSNQKKEEPFFWQVQGENTEVYMLGSVHIGSEDMYPLDELVETSFRQSDALVVEADILQMEESYFEDNIMMKAVYMDGSTLVDYLSDKTYQKVITVLDDFKQEGVTMEQLVHFKPWFIEMMLSDMYFSQLENYTSENGIDYYFLEQAVEHEKQILELEGITEQLNFTADVPESSQIYALEEMLRVLEEDNQQELIDLIEAWKTGDERVLEQFLYPEVEATEEAQQYATYQAQLMDDRNEGMAEKISSYLTSEGNETYFIVVGAAHFLGDTGIDNLLEKQGYEVQSYAELSKN